MSLLAKTSVRVPASTSNLGPAFDCLGLALGLYNELTLELHTGEAEPVVEISGEGADSLPKDGTNLMVRAARTVLDDRARGRLVFKARNRIPLSRGLGSSAAAIVAGLTAGGRLLGKPKLSLQELFVYAATLEGHPDNVAPALFGGLVACVRDGQEVAAHALSPHKDLRAVVCVPEFELSTAKARAVLPKTVLREQAVANISRALLLSSSLERGLWGRLGQAMEDELHQPYREPLVKGLPEAIAAAKAAGACGAALSGAGPTVLALAHAGLDLKVIGKAMQEAFRRRGVKSGAMTLEIERDGARVLK